MKIDFNNLERVIILAIVLVGMVALYTIREQGDKINSLEQKINFNAEMSNEADMDLWRMQVGDDAYWNVVNQRDIPYCNMDNVIIAGIYYTTDAIQIDYVNKYTHYAAVILTNGTKTYLNFNKPLFASDFCQLIGGKTW